MVEVVETVLNSMSNVKQPQRLFMASLFSILMVFQGKATFRNMSRYSHLSEKCFSRWSRREFDFSSFNHLLLEQVSSAMPHRIAAIDASFVSKSGKKTDGLGKFYNGSAGEAQQGLEMSLICMIDLTSNTAYALESQQTIDQAGQSRVDFYANQIVTLAPKMIKQGIQYLVGDAYYSKSSFVDPVLKTGLQVVGKLRVDANLQWLYTGKYKGKGRPRKFDGKVNFDDDLSRFDHLGTDDSGVDIYTSIVHSSLLKSSVRIVMLRWVRDGKVGRALLYSTDVSLDAHMLIQYYRARFQIEFLFRDAKQYTGLTHCQSLRKEAIHLQVNASLSALNILKMEDRERKATNKQTVISIASWKRRKFNQHLMERLFETLGLSIKDQKVRKVYQELSDYGAVAA